MYCTPQFSSALKTNFLFDNRKRKVFEILEHLPYMEIVAEIRVMPVSRVSLKFQLRFQDDLSCINEVIILCTVLFI